VSFVERNRRWLLPLLGAGVAGVLWMNLPVRTAAAAEHAAPAAAPEAPPQDDAQPQPPPVALSLEQDFKFLETPEPSDPVGLLAAGRQVLGAALREPRRAELHPDQWGRLPGIPPPSRAPGPGPRAALQPPPPVDFLIETSAGPEAWIKGVGYRPGATLEGGYKLKRITGTGVVLAGPRGEEDRPLRSAP
jgi:hypothetical protein